jgi:ribosomal protein L23
MALFSRNKETTTPDASAPVKKGATSRTLPTDRNLSAVLKHPHITEKAVAQGERQVYTFIVDARSTKRTIAQAVKAQYNVTPVKVNVVNKAAKKVYQRAKGRTITENGMKKAYVYLKKGDSISLV